MNSMTGFGRAEVTRPIGRIAVEIASVNNRFLELSVRLPRLLSSFEPPIRALLSDKLARGKVTLQVAFELADSLPGRWQINEAAVATYLKQLRRLQKESGLAGELTVADILHLPDIVDSSPAILDNEKLWAAAKSAVMSALKELQTMRKAEGEAMATDMSARLETLKTMLSRIELASKDAVPAYRDRLREKIADLMSAPAPDTLRLEEEVALIADRCDITEEMVRFESHLKQFKSTLKSKDAVGRRLNFLLQELNREANTIGSKSAEYAISSEVIAIKEELEKLRELVQNVE